MNQVQTDVSTDESVCQNIVESVASAEGTSPTDLSPPLYEVIDSDALESLFASGQTSGKVVFNYGSYEVSVFSDGFVSVDPLDA